MKLVRCELISSVSSVSDSELKCLSCRNVCGLKTQKTGRIEGCVCVCPRTSIYAFVRVTKEVYEVSVDESRYFWLDCRSVTQGETLQKNTVK